MVPGIPTCEAIVKPIVRRGKSGGFKTEHRDPRPCGRIASRARIPDGMFLCGSHGKGRDTQPIPVMDPACVLQCALYCLRDLIEVQRRGFAFDKNLIEGCKENLQTYQQWRALGGPEPAWGSSRGDKVATLLQVTLPVLKALMIE